MMGSNTGKTKLYSDKYARQQVCVCVCVCVLSLKAVGGCQLGTASMISYILSPILV